MPPEAVNPTVLTPMFAVMLPAANFTVEGEIPPAYLTVMVSPSEAVLEANALQDASPPGAATSLTVSFDTVTDAPLAVQVPKLADTVVFFSVTVPFGVRGVLNVIEPPVPLQLKTPEAALLWLLAHAGELDARPATVPRGIAIATRTDANFRYGCTSWPPWGIDCDIVKNESSLTCVTDSRPFDGE